MIPTAQCVDREILPAEDSVCALQKQSLFGAGAVAGGIKEAHIFGLGSGPKQEVRAVFLSFIQCSISSLIHRTTRHAIIQ
jgi:hypothetical protein